MIEAALLQSHEAPEGFTYPSQLKEMIFRGVLTLHPWKILTGEELRCRKSGLEERYPERRLVPFASRADNDDVACWQGLDTKNVIIIHDFASAGWELRSSYENFDEWLRAVFEDMIDYLHG